MKTSTYANFCERCGTPIHKLADFGSNVDGTINTEYCHDCFVRGEFVDRGITLEEKAERQLG